jgi:tRNA(fMet)-specific endonuclease VapC
MPTYLLDTDILSLFQHQHQQVLTSILLHASDTICVCTVTLEEQLSGWSSLARAAKSHAEHERASTVLGSLVQSWCRFGLLLQTAQTLVRYESLLKAKLNVGRYDLRIASIALELGATVVTRNRRDFSRVPGLSIEDWSV